MGVMTSDQYTELVAYLGQKFGGIERRLDAHDRNFEQIEGRFARIDGQFEGIDGQFARIDGQFAEVRRHATVLFEEARDERRKLAEGLEARFDARCDSLEGKVVSLEDKVDSVERKVGSVDHKVDSLDASVRGTLADHEARLQALE